MNPIDTYLSHLSDEDQLALNNLRSTLHMLIPGATECISYGIPTLKLDGKWIAGFAKFKHHLAFFPFSGSIFEHFPEEMKSWKHTQSSLHFTPETPIPREFLEKMIQKRLEL